jgi:hypothetical protein
MMLAASIEVYAGGPGSGCRGNNCGRPKGSQPIKQNIDEVKRVQKLMEKEFPWVRSVDKKLLSLGGRAVDHTTSNADTEGYLNSYLSKFGRAYDAKGSILMRGVAHECHGNVCALVKKGKIAQAATGYGLDGDNGVWYRHTWGVAGDRVIETTGRMAAYYGVELDEKFEKWVDSQDE